MRSRWVGGADWVGLAEWTVMGAQVRSASVKTGEEFGGCMMKEKGIGKGVLLIVDGIVLDT